MWLIPVLFYVAVGLITHLAVIGTTFSPAIIVSWICVLAWPAIWFATLFLIAFAGFLIAVVCLSIGHLWSALPFVARARRRKFVQRPAR